MEHGVKRSKLSEQARVAKLEKDRSKIARYKALSQTVLDAKGRKVYTQESLDATTTLLDLNPEYNAVWNFRRKILTHLFKDHESSKIASLSGDLRMVLDMMKQFPKCYWIWNHRKWCLEELDRSGDANWEYELAIVSKLLELDSRNFHGWHYRRYVMSKLENAKLKQTTGEKQAAEELNLLIGEFLYTTQKINRNISNFSAWHNRTLLLRKIFDVVQSLQTRELLHEHRDLIQRFQSTHELMKYELNLVKTGMYMDSDDTSVWLYMKWLLTCDLFKSCCDVQLLDQQLQDIEELNTLEKADSKTGQDHTWCLKMIVFLRALKCQKTHVEAHQDSVIEDCLRKLSESDPLRKGHYSEQLAGRAPLIC